MLYKPILDLRLKICNTAMLYMQSCDVVQTGIRFTSEIFSNPAMLHKLVLALSEHACNPAML